MDSIEINKIAAAVLCAAAAGLIRALEDTRRQVRLQTAELGPLQAQNAYPGPVPAARAAASTGGRSA